MTPARACLALARGAVVALIGLAAVPAPAQDATRGRTLYKTYCQVCHTVDPSTAVAPFNQIMAASNEPSRIAAAAAIDPSQM